MHVGSTKHIKIWIQVQPALRNLHFLSPDTWTLKASNLTENDPYLFQMIEPDQLPPAASIGG
jgi:hypothetical protein